MFKNSFCFHDIYLTLYLNVMWYNALILNGGGPPKFQNRGRRPIPSGRILRTKICFDAPLHIPYVFVRGVVNYIHIVNTACWLKSKYLHIYNEHLQKQVPFFSKWGGHAPGMPVLDPALLKIQTIMKKILPADKHLKYICFVRYIYLICERFVIHNFVFMVYQKFKQLFNSPFWYNCITMLDIRGEKIQLVTFQAFYMYYGKYICMMYNQLVYNLHVYNNITFLSLWRDRFSSQSSQLQVQFFSNVFPCKMSPIFIFSWFLLWLTPVWNFTNLLCILLHYDLGCEIKLYDMIYM